MASPAVDTTAAPLGDVASPAAAPAVVQVELTDPVFAAAVMYDLSLERARNFVVNRASDRLVAGRSMLEWNTREMNGLAGARDPTPYTTGDVISLIQWRIPAAPPLGSPTSAWFTIEKWRVRAFVNIAALSGAPEVVRAIVSKFEALHPRHGRVWWDGGQRDVYGDSVDGVKEMRDWVISTLIPVTA
jgi:hypothetical protein